MPRTIVLGILATILAPLSGAVPPGTCNSTATCAQAIAGTQDAQAQAALERIPGSGAKLLAMHSYLRAGATLAQRWSWTAPQIEAFAGSAHERQITAAVASVRREFELANPGYTILVNSEVRSLERQLRAWNANASVAAAAGEFEAAASRVINRQVSGAGGIPVRDFAAFVRDHKPQPSPNLAAPGLSRHGQMYAVDFHVLRGNAVVADTDSATIASVWVAQGWAQRVRAAVITSSAPFVGPLRGPDEPWHYDYHPTPAVPGE